MAMVPLEYVGPFTTVEVEVAPNRWQEVANGEAVEIHESLAAGLLDQPDNWRAAAPVTHATIVHGEGESTDAT